MARDNSNNTSRRYSRKEDADEADKLLDEVLGFKNNSTTDVEKLPKNPTEEFLKNQELETVSYEVVEAPIQDNEEGKETSKKPSKETKNALILGSLGNDFGQIGFFSLNEKGQEVLSAEIISLAPISNGTQCLLNLKDLKQQPNVSKELAALCKYLENDYRLDYCIFLV